NASAAASGAKINLTPPRGGLKIKLNHPGKPSGESAPEKSPAAPAPAAAPAAASVVQSAAAVENKSTEAVAAHVVAPPAEHKLS
ncbi:MAG: hypothetical protein RRY34_07600, partial [Victivallaceae bacterium]